MSQTFHHRRGSRKALWLGLVFFPLMAIVIAIGVLDAPPQNRAWFLLFMGAFWFTMFALNIWGLLASYRESWHLSGDRFIHQGIFRRQEISFSQMTELRWRLWPGRGSIVLKSEIDRIAIDVDTFELEERVALIHLLHSAIPEQNQIGWPMFCQRFAVPLLDRLIHQGVFRRKEILFSQGTELRWRLWPGRGSIALKSETGRIFFRCRHVRT